MKVETINNLFTFTVKWNTIATKNILNLQLSGKEIVDKIAVFSIKSEH